MKKETREAAKTYVPLILFTTLLMVSHQCEDGSYEQGLLQGLACGLLLMALIRIVAFYADAFRAKPPYTKLKQQRHGNNQTI